MTLLEHCLSLVRYIAAQQHLLFLHLVMLFLSLLCFSSLVNASPAFGPLSRISNPLSFISDQFPLHALSEFTKGKVQEDAFFYDRQSEEGTIWEIIKNNPRLNSSLVTLIRN